MNNKYTFGVITKVTSCSEVGNMSSVLLTRDFNVEKETEELGFRTSRSYRALDDKELEDDFDLKHEDLAWGLLPVFELGEILILDGPYGREVSGKARKPSKWFIECEYFSDLDEAVERSKAVISEYEKQNL